MGPEKSSASSKNWLNKAGMKGGWPVRSSWTCTQNLASEICRWTALRISKQGRLDRPRQAMNGSRSLCAALLLNSRGESPAALHMGRKAVYRVSDNSHSGIPFRMASIALFEETTLRI
jgi:hypothetical protein